MYGETAMWLFEHCLTGPTEAVVRSRVALKNSVIDITRKGALWAYFEVVLLLQERYAIENVSANLDNKICALRQENLTLKVLV